MVVVVVVLIGYWLRWRDSGCAIARVAVVIVVGLL